MKKNVYMVQVDLSYGNEDKSVYLPYAIGLLASFAWANKTVEENYCLGRLVFRREHITAAIDSFENPYLVGFSNYVWNFEYNKLFAQELKKRYPACIVVFGGHHVPPDSSLLDTCPSIDILVHGEGEEIFRDILVALHSDTSLYNIPNISFRSISGLSVSTESRTVACQLDNLPSPYLNGIFDALVAQNKSQRFSAILETSRGCPFHCAFCDWTQLHSKVRRASLKRVEQEIIWMSIHKIDYIWGADANFGIFEDDITIVEWLVREKNKTGFPEILNMNYAKNNFDSVFQINKMLNDAGMCRGVPLSFQSLLPTVLRNIGRENMPLTNFTKLLAKYKEAGIPAYSELILGLPGETYESFCRGMGILLEAGQHNTINVYNYELLCNSSMGSPESVAKFKIETIKIPLVRFHCALSETYITELSNIVVSTYSMSREMWRQTSLFSVIVQCFHNLGLLQCYAIYLFYEKGVKYETFYQRLQKWIEANRDSVCGRIYTKLNSCYDDVLAGNGGLYYSNPIFGDIVWSYVEAMLLDIVLELEQFYEELRDFMKSFDIDESVFKDLYQYQNSVIKLPNKDDVNIQLDYDFYRYFMNVYLNQYAPLDRKPNILHVKDNNCTKTWVDYARENVWYRHNFAGTMLTEISPEYIDVV